jgi:nucleoside-diphosphate-sugar epimerase
LIATTVEPLDLTDGLQVRDYLGIQDVADGVLMAAASAAAGSVHVLASGKPITLRELGRIICAARLERTGFDAAPMLRWGARARRPDDRDTLVGDPEPARLALGWEPRTPLVQTVDELVQHHHAMSMKQEESAAG